MENVSTSNFMTLPPSNSLDSIPKTNSHAYFINIERPLINRSKSFGNEIGKDLESELADPKFVIILSFLGILIFFLFIIKRFLKIRLMKELNETRHEDLEAGSSQTQPDFNSIAGPTHSTHATKGEEKESPPSYDSLFGQTKE